MANRAGKKLIKAVAKDMGKKTALTRTYDGRALKEVKDTGVGMGVSKRKMSKAIDKGLTQGLKAKNKALKSAK